MGDHYPAEDCAAGLLERRWFAALRVAAEVRAECEAIAAVRQMVEERWHTTRIRLSQLEALSDALGDELSAIPWSSTHFDRR